MRFAFSFRNLIRFGAGLAVVVGPAVLLSSSDDPVFSPADKAYYADANLVNFVRPGLVIKIQQASIAEDGTVQVRFKLTDPKGLPLDREGVTTPGAISPRFILATIPKDKTQYVAYTVRNVTSPINGQKAAQATTDSGGKFDKVGDGEYTYTLATKAPAGYDKSATHSVGVYATRDLSEFDLGTDIAQEVYSWVPDGTEVKTTRDVIRTESCNRCHDPIQAHGSRRTIEMCVLCHTPQTTDPDTGLSMDMPEMTHKIHMGRDLPSVKAGRPYQIIGHNQSVADFSHVGFPTDKRNCTICHEQNTGAAQADAYLKPSRGACGACHDDVNFATGENHVNLPQISDNQCAGCHLPEGELEFDASIKGAHQIPRFSRELPGLQFTIKEVRDGAAGKNPTVIFALKDKKDQPMEMVNRLSLVLAGPTSDYATYVSEDVTKATALGNGEFSHTFAYQIPADAKGTYAVGIEGYKNVTIMAGTKKEQSVRNAGVNKLTYFSVDGSAVAPRRAVVSLDKCNSCHGNLSLHGDNRNQIEQCVLCHAPNTDDRAYRPADQMPANSIQMAYMVHRIHTGEHSEQEYTLYGRGGTAYPFHEEVRYPGDLRNCNACHVDGSEQKVAQPGLLAVQHPRGVLNPMGPATAACTGCHTETFTASHALSNTTEKLGEACGACHSTDYEFGVPKVHAR
jgi:OmcA/MtrC family decaheme c-type cytochrome